MSPNFICLTSCLARWPKWRVSKGHSMRERTSGSWVPNWFSSKMRWISSFVRATVAIWFVPLTLLVEFRSLGFKYFSGDLEFLIFEDIELCFDVFQLTLHASWEGWHCFRFVSGVVPFLHSNVEIAQKTVELGRAISVIPRLSPHSSKNFWSTFMSYMVFWTVLTCCWLPIKLWTSSSVSSFHFFSSLSKEVGNWRSSVSDRSSG